MRKLIYYMAALIALYLALVHWGGLSQDISHSFKGASELTATLQGR